MTLSIDQIQAAKAEALEFLEYSIYRLGLTLGLLPDELSADLEIPVPENDPLFIAYQSLVKQIIIAEKLGG